MPLFDLHDIPDMIQLDGVEYRLVSQGGVPAIQQTKIEYQVPQVAQGAVTSANLPSGVAEAHEINRFVAGFGQARQEPGQQTLAYRYGVDADAALGTGVHAAPAQVSLNLAGSANVTQYIEFQSNLYAAAGRYLRKITSSDAITLIQDFGSGKAITSLAVFRGDDGADRLFIAVSGDTGFWSYDGTTVTQDAVVTDGLLLAAMFTQDSGATYTKDTVSPFALTLNSLDTLANGDWIVIGGAEDFHGVRILIGNANGNASTLAVHYWTGTAWATVSALSDGTATDGASFAKTGNITWTPVADMGSDVIASERLVAVRLSFSAALDASVTTTDIALIQRHQASKFLAFSDAESAYGSALYRTHKKFGRPAISQSFDGGSAPTWGGTIVFGDQGEAVTNTHGIRGRALVETDRDAYLFTTDFVSLSEALLPEWHDAPDSDNGKASRSLNGVLFLARRQTLRAYNPLATDGVNLVSVGIEALVENDTPIVGPVTALAHDDFFLIASIYNGADSYLIRLPQIRGVVAQWHSWIKIVGSKCEALWVSEFVSGERRLYFGAGSEGGYVKLPVNGPTPLNPLETTPRYVTRWDFYPPRTTTHLLQFNSLWAQVTVVGDNISAANYVEVFYRIVEGGDWTSLDRVTASGTPLAFPAETTNHWVDIYLTVHGTATSTVILRSLAVEYRKVYPYFRRWVMALDVQKTFALNLALRSQPAATVLARLDALVAASGTATLHTPWGQEFEVFVDDGQMDLSNFDGAYEGGFVRVLRCDELRQLDTEGSWDDLAGFSWAKLADFDWDALLKVRSS